MLQREPVVMVPPELVIFDGQFATVAEWDAAFDAWCVARAGWEVAHPGMVLPEQILSECPLDPVLPHGGVWSRLQPDDGEGMRCAEHDLSVAAHEVLPWS